MILPPPESLPPESFLNGIPLGASKVCNTGGSQECRKLWNKGRSISDLQHLRRGGFPTLGTYKGPKMLEIVM